VSAGARPVTERLLATLDPRPGQTILELGGGVGEVGLAVAERVGFEGHVLITDQSEAMVDAARRRAEGRRNVTCRTADAQALDLPAESVDGVVSRYVIMLVADPAAGLAEARRVLRPGGRFVAAVWASADENRWGSTIGRTMVALGLADPPEPDAPGPFRLGDVERVRSLVVDAGFEPPEIDDVPVTMRYESFDDYWTITSDLSMTLRNALERLSDDDAAAVRKRVESMLSAYADEDGRLAVPGLARVVATRRPA
jgi:SAM-dependent methyltransferase